MNIQVMAICRQIKQQYRHHILEIDYQVQEEEERYPSEAQEFASWLEALLNAHNVPLQHVCNQYADKYLRRLYDYQALFDAANAPNLGVDPGEKESVAKDYTSDYEKEFDRPGQGYIPGIGYV